MSLRRDSTRHDEVLHHLGVFVRSHLPSTYHLTVDLPECNYEFPQHITTTILRLVVYTGKSYVPTGTYSTCQKYSCFHTVIWLKNCVNVSVLLPFYGRCARLEPRALNGTIPSPFLSEVRVNTSLASQTLLTSVWLLRLS